jgi:hypothetical protein
VEFCDRVNAREHRVTRRAPAVMLAEERARLHRLRALPHTVCFGQTRKMTWQSTISVGGAIYSVPSRLVDARVWARVDGDELVVVHADAPDGPREVARHALTAPGRPSIQEEHYPPRAAGALERRPRALGRRAGVPGDRAGGGALADRGRGGRHEQAAAQARRGRRAGQAAGAAAVDEALAVATDAGRFGDGDLAAIVAHRGARVIAFPARVPEERSLQRSTRSWEGFGA